VIKKAVERNRIKRTFSEAVRPFLKRKTSGFDIVIGVVRSFDKDALEIQALLSELLEKGKIFSKT